jgi:hypothetical protein
VQGCAGARTQALEPRSDVWEWCLRGACGGDTVVVVVAMVGSSATIPQLPNRPTTKLPNRSPVLAHAGVEVVDAGAVQRELARQVGRGRGQRAALALKLGLGVEASVVWMFYRMFMCGWSCGGSSLVRSGGGGGSGRRLRLRLAWAWGPWRGQAGG